jgi:phosphodiesterase/alkaline phosphatase D-like protein
MKRNIHPLCWGAIFGVAPLSLTAQQILAGPWCGAVTPSSISATAHVSAAGIQTRLVVSTNANFGDPIYSPTVSSAVVSGNNVRMDLGGLTPDTAYYYAVELNGVLQTAVGKTGSFRTLPAPGPVSFRYGFASCGDWHEPGQYVYQTILTENPLFFIHMGDFQYEDTDEDDVEPYRENIINAITLSPPMGEMLRKLPTSYIWDDHDFSGNTSDRTSEGRTASRQAYRELVPHYPLPAGGPDEAIYQAFTCGRVRFILSDLRSERDRDSDTDNASKSMMGDIQKQWFKDQLVAARDAEAPLIVWMSGVPLLSDSSVRDNWGSYKTERKELLEFIRDQKIRNVIVISGDMHALAYDDGRATETYVAGVRIPVFHAAAMTRDGSEKGGPYSGGVSEGPGRYGLMDIVDNGSALSATYHGRIASSSTTASTWKATLTTRCQPFRVRLPPCRRSAGWAQFS